MGWQWLVIGLFLAAAVAYLARRAWRTWKGLGSGCGGCKCPAPSAPAAGAEKPLISIEEITLRLRRRG